MIGHKSGPFDSGSLTLPGRVWAMARLGIILAAMLCCGCLSRTSGTQFPYIKPADSVPQVDPARVRLVSRMEGLEMELQNLRNMVERLQSIEGNLASVKDLERRIAFIEKQLGIESSPAPAPLSADPGRAEPLVEPSRDAAGHQESTPMLQGPGAGESGGASPDSLGSDQIIEVTSPELSEDAVAYKQAYDVLTKGADAKAARLFKGFLEKHPDSEYAADANYWLGEALFNQGLYDESVLQFDKTIKEHPGFKKEPNALLKQGKAFEKMGDEKSARVIYEKLVEKYPHTPQARLARKRIEAIKPEN